MTMEQTLATSLNCGRIKDACRPLQITFANSLDLLYFTKAQRVNYIILNIMTVVVSDFC